MFFSVIIPAYNAEKYLPKALSSLYNQTFADYEVIIVDDGSTDRTGAIADSYADTKTNMVVIHQRNSGLLLARRAGLKKAHGQYVVFLDADDCLHPHTLQRVAETISDTGADIVSFRYCRNLGFNRSDTSSPLPAGLYSNEKFAEARKHLCSGRFNNMWGKAIKLNLFDGSEDYTI